MHPVSFHLSYNDAVILHALFKKLNIHEDDFCIESLWVNMHFCRIHSPGVGHKISSFHRKETIGTHNNQLNIIKVFYDIEKDLYL